MGHPGGKKGPKAYELATECGVSARELLLAARELGINVQNRLTRIDDEAAQRLRVHLDERRRGHLDMEGEGNDLEGGGS
jgi:hypothetical protein